MLLTWREKQNLCDLPVQEHPEKQPKSSITKSEMIFKNPEEDKQAAHELINRNELSKTTELGAGKMAPEAIGGHWFPGA